MGVALRGNLRDFGIADVFQLIGQQRKTGVLELSGNHQRVELRFDRGAVVSAAPIGARPHAALGEMLVRCGLLTRDRVDRLHRDCESSARTFPRLAVDRGELSEEDLREIDDLLTRETIFSVMRWSNGSFDFVPRRVEHERPFEALLGAEQILMDGLRMLDEWQSLAERVPSETAVFRRVHHFDVYREQGGARTEQQMEAAERIFFLIDGRLAVRRIIDLSRLGTFDAMRILAGLRSAGVIEPLGPAEVRRLRSRRRMARFDRAQVRGWIAVAFPLSLLLLLAATSSPGRPAGERLGIFPIHRSPLAAASDAYAVRRLRHAIETYRFAAGSWPEKLSDLNRRRLLEARSLASPAGRPYYYARRDESIVVLAPER